MPNSPQLPPQSTAGVPPFPYFPYFPDSAYKDTSGDKPTPISKPHFREYFRDFLVIGCIASALIRLAWIFAISGSPSTHIVIMTVVGLIAGLSAILLIATIIPESRVRLDKSGIRWALTLCIGTVTAFLLHYTLFE